MRIFFSLAPHFMSSGEYETNARRMAQTFDMKPVFAHDIPPQADPADWIATALSECQFAFFDLTGFDADVLFAFGIASQNDDVSDVALIDIDEHEKLTGRRIHSKFFTTGWMKKVKTFIGASDFPRKAQMIIADSVGPSVLKDQRLIGRIKEEVRRAPVPLYMRQIATSVGRPMIEVQPVVYELVRDGDFEKVNDKRWAQYKERR